MDWYSWLSRTNLEPTLAYEYGLAFVRNELQEEDLAYFNHEFLQSIGISIAKHRLEILKLARKETRGKINSFSKLVLVMNKTRKLFTKTISNKWGLHKNPSSYPVSELSPYRNQWSGALKRLNYAKENEREHQKPVISCRNHVMWSGPLDKRMQQKLMMTRSGPLEGPNWSPMVGRPVKDQRTGFICRSPTMSGPAVDRWGLSPMKVNHYSSEKDGDDDDDYDGAKSLWSLMFQDMKPT